MGEQLDFQLCSAHLQSALLFMEARSIPPTPLNFRIWYEYSEGGYNELNQFIDQLIAEKVNFDDAINDDIYSRFFSELPLEQLREFKAALKSLTTELGIRLAELSPECNDCEAAIKQAEQALASDCELDALKEITAQLVAQSRQLLSQNGQMKQLVESMQSEMTSLEVNLEKAHTEAMTDELTGVANRRAFERKIDSVLSNFSSGQQACLLTMDIDKFKDFNDQHGHLMGDKVLQFVVKMIKKVIKGKDFLARTGGEEFQLLLEDCILSDAVNIAEDIRRTIESTKLTRGRDRTPVGCVTLSIGVATLNAGEDREQLVHRADQYLYQAKTDGRNRVISQ